MRMSQREKFLLLIVGSVLIVILYFQFIFMPGRAKVAEIRSEYESTKARYDEVTRNIKTLEDRKILINQLQTSINEKSSQFYPTLIQEKIILQLDELIKETGIKATIGFSPIVAQPVEYLSDGQYQKPYSSLQDLVNKYLALRNQEDNTNKPIDQNNQIPQVITSTSTAELMTVSLVFSGSYDAVKNFLDLIQKNDYNLVITNLSMTPQNINEVMGNMNIEFYGIPKISVQDNIYLNWSLNNIYGKDKPFSTGIANGAYNSTMEDTIQNNKSLDFMVIVRSNASDLPSLTIGKANDDTRESYLFSDKNDIEDITLHFYQDGLKYYYEYNTLSDKYPQNNDKGLEFKPSSNQITIDIISEARVSPTDNSGANITIQNDTDLEVNAVIKDDDTTLPRIKVIGKGYTVNIKK